MANSMKSANKELANRLKGYRVDQCGVEPCDDGLCLHVQCSRCNPAAKPSIYGKYLAPGASVATEQPPLIKDERA